MPPIIELRHIRKEYTMPGGLPITILDDIDLEVEEGELLAILGPSGSGKSTLLRIIAGLIPPTSGEVYYMGQKVTGVNAGVAMVFQSFALFPWLTVQENVELGLKAKGVPPRERQAKALRILDMIGLDGFEGAYPKELSGGMRQRVGFARALVVDPGVLLMDEPFSALDVLTAENLRRDLLELWLERRIPTKAIIIVTHSIEEAVYMADRCVILSKDPARVIANISIPLPHWREKEDYRFIKLVDQIYAVLTERRAEDGGIVIARRQAIPATRAGAMAGLLELLDDLEGQADLYRLGDELNMDIDALLPIVDGLTLLGFARVDAGDITLTEAGRQFARANLLERKELFRQQALERVEPLRHIVRVLHQKSNRRMNREFFLDLLERFFDPEEAERQLDTLIDWGRYAELFAYDQESEQIFLEENEAITPAEEAP